MLGLADANQPAKKPAAKKPAPQAKPVVEAKQAPKAITHVVRNGESDWTISKKYGVTVHDIHLANPGVDWLKLQIGHELTIPNGSGPVAAPPKQAAPKQASAKPAAAPTGTYVVRKGENDWLIASRLGITRQQLVALNPKVNWDRLQIGAKLIVPKGKIQNAVDTGAIRSRYAAINAESVIIRRGPSTSAGKVTQVGRGTRVTVLDREGSWYKLKFPKGTVGWVRGDLLKSVSSAQVASRTTSTKSRSSATAGAKNKKLVVANTSGKGIVERALGYRGVRYSYGAASRSATDCSGLTSQVYRAAGVALPRTSGEQAKVGQAVGKASLKKGDLVFFKTNRGTRINHVGIYIGDGKFVHASSGGGKVKVDSINEGYYQRRYAGARRVAVTKPATETKKETAPAKKEETAPAKSAAVKAAEKSEEHKADGG
ncbi:MAG: NlpC/P60 family protein [Fimbriimonadaceae bacterium]|nr:NlpC/P60 family protein [Fimbriimonadaceae bacterium]